MAKWFCIFLFYSLAGYGLEKIFAWAVRSERQVRKCFLLLPLCPVYGLAMTAVIALAPEDWGFWPLAALGGAVCTAVEYGVHLFYDKAFGVWFWDYRPLRGNIGGRVCPHFALAWGALSAFAVERVQPWVEFLAEHTPPEAVYVLWVVLAADCVLSGALLLRSHDTELLSLGALRSYRRDSSQPSTSL